MEERIVFKTEDNLNLIGILTKPKHDTKKCVILCHGFKVNKDEVGNFIKLSKELCDSGYASFRFDFRGHGESEGIDYEVTASKEICDLEATYKLILDKGYNEIVLLGASFGAGIISLFKPYKYKEIKSIVLWYGSIDYSVGKSASFGEDRFKIALENGYVEVNNSVLDKPFRVGKNAFLERKKLEPYKELLNLDIPILFVNGTKDESTPCERNKEIANMCKNSKFVTVENGMHGFHSDEQINVAIDETLKFIKSIF